MGTTLREMCGRLGVPYTTLATWIEQGVIEPERRVGRQGAAVVLSRKNSVELENLVRLRRGGLSMQRARALMEDLRAQGYNPLSRGLFIVADPKRGRVIRISEDRATAHEVAGPNKGQYVMIRLLPEAEEKPPVRRKGKA